VTFFDSATASTLEGHSPANKLYINSSTPGLITGATSAGFSPLTSQYRYPLDYINPNQAGKVKYTITHVRKSK